MRKRKSTVSDDQICLSGFFEEQTGEAMKTAGTLNNAVYVIPSLFDLVTAASAVKKSDPEVVPGPIEKPMEYYPSHPISSAVDAQEQIERNIVALKVMDAAKVSCSVITAPEQACIAAYAGWDGLASTKEEKAALTKQLESEFSPNVAKSLLAMPQYPYVPEPWAAQSVFLALKRMGFSAGNILCVGSGNGALLRAMPTEMRENSVLFAEATDAVNQDLLSLLYPSVKTYAPEDELPASFFDTAIGIIPTAPNDKATLKYKGQTATFERYAYHLAKTLCALRTGGIMAVLMPSSMTDDMANKLSPFELSATPLLYAGGLRLNWAAVGNGQSYDLLCFQKQVKSGTAKESVLALDKILIPRMVSTKTSNKVQLKLPQYFSWNPQMVIGEYLYGDGKTFPQESILIPLTSDHVNAIADAVDGWDCEDIFAPISVDGESEDSNVRPAEPSVKNYSMVMFQDGKVWQRVDSTMVRQKLSGIRLERVIGMIAIRDAAIRLIQLQFTDCTDDELEEAQRNLSAYYFPFVKKYGHVTERTNTLLFREDADFSVLAALEYTDEEDVIHQADIFTKRTIQIRPPVTSCETPDEALLVCLDQRAVVDIDYIAELCACTSTEVIRALEGRLIFKNTDPLSNDAWLPQDVYLVGNVRKKLAEARAAALLDARFETNVVALENAAPPLIPFSDIFINLGAPYIPAETISSFVFDVFGKKKTPTSVDNVEVRRNKHDKWHIHISDTILPTDPYYFGEFGVKKYSAIWILEHLLNNTDLVATKKDKDPTGKDITVRDPEGTLILVEKAQAIKTAFAEWLSRHPDQQTIISALYNDIYNHSVIPRYDGSHLTFPGMTASIQLDPHQKNAVYRIIRDNGAYIAHVVGAGKTITLLTAGMELKRLGRVSKPLYVVPNNLISQWVGELQRLYPAASILAADPDDMRGNRRKRMLARMATGAYDAIIMGSSSFINLPPPYSAVQQAIEDRKQRVENSPFTDGCSGQAAINEAAKAIQESAVFFNRSMRESYTLADLGVDFLLVDESHEYKNLGARSSIGDVKGIPNTHSAKCLDMYYKTKYMSSLHGGKGGFVFASGTPYSNSIVEMYTVLRYFNEQVLLDSGIFSLDEWLAIYGKITNEWEIPPEGLAEDGEGLRQVRRVSGFANLPELMAQVLQFMDVVGRDDLKAIDLPTAVRKTTVARPSVGQKDYMSNLVARANKVRHRSSRKRGATAPTIRETDNMLLITVDGRKCALDARMVDPIAFPVSCGKLALCARQIADYYREYDVLKGTQLVFSEMAVSKQTNFSAYVALKDLLVANGIPEQEIAFAQDFDTPAKKRQMRVKMQCGKLRVLIGSTPSLGQGVNVQNRLIALHHLDVPWVPKDLEQREGRIIRRGNMHANIFIHTYVTEGSFDAYMWQLVEAKARIIAQIMRGDHTQRTLEESDTKVLSYAEVKALATGNTAYLERAKIEGELVRLATLKRNFDASMETMRQNVYVNLPTAIASLRSLIPKMESDIAMFEKNKATPEITISGMIYPLTSKERPNITKALNAVMKLSPAGDVLGSFLGFDMILTKQFGWSLLCPERTVVLQGQTSHKLDDFNVFSGSSALDCCLRVCRLMPDELKAKQSLLVSNETALRATTAMLGEKFEHEDRINELKAELDRLTKEIAKCA